LPPQVVEKAMSDGRAMSYDDLVAAALGGSSGEAKSRSR